MSKKIVCLSGGKASAYCAKIAFDTYDKNDIILYFNDTKWEHPDLYRFLDDLQQYFNHTITNDSDGRDIEQLFHDEKALAYNLMPFCSRIMKGQRLKKFYSHGDTLIFGIDSNEGHRATRLVSTYQKIQIQTKKECKLEFPLIKKNVSKSTIDDWLNIIGIKQPILYDMGFSHNNCSGGCVRAGKKQWFLLYKRLPNIYAERERVEEDIRKLTGKDIHYLKDETLKEFRYRIENGLLSTSHYELEDESPIECIGVCDSQQ